MDSTVPRGLLVQSRLPLITARPHLQGFRIDLNLAGSFGRATRISKNAEYRIAQLYGGTTLAIVNRLAPQHRTGIVAFATQPDLMGSHRPAHLHANGEGRT